MTSKQHDAIKLDLQDVQLTVNSGVMRLSDASCLKDFTQSATTLIQSAFIVSVSLFCVPNCDYLN